jgi:hypothetical protein
VESPLTIVDGMNRFTRHPGVLTDEMLFKAAVATGFVLV